MSVFKSAFGISFFTLISRILGFARDMIIASRLGTGPIADIFFIALRIPNLFRAIFAEGAFTQAFLPIFSHYLVTNGEKQAYNFASKIYYYFLSALIILVVVFELLMPSIMLIFAPGYADDQVLFAKLVLLSRITFPYILLISIATLINSILNGFKIFAPGNIMAVLYNASLILSLYLFEIFIKDASISLALGVAMSGIVQLIYIYLALFKRKNLILPKRLKGFKVGLKNFTKKFFPAILSSAVLQINILVSTIIASFIPNAVSYLYYADRLIQLPLALIATAISTAMLPSLVEFIGKNEKEKSNQLINKSLSATLFLAMPATIGLAFLSHEIVFTLLVRGKFIYEDGIATGKVIQIYSLALPAYILSKIFLACFYAEGDTKTPLKISIISLIINLCCSLYFVKIFSYLGIILATVISSWSNLLLLLILLLKRKAFTLTKANKIKLLKILFSSILMMLSLMILIKIPSDFVELHFIKKSFWLGCHILISGLIYLVTAKLLKIWKFSLQI